MNADRSAAGILSNFATNASGDIDAVVAPYGDPAGGPVGAGPISADALSGVFEQPANTKQREATVSSPAFFDFITIKIASRNSIYTIEIGSARIVGGRFRYIHILSTVG